MENFQISGLKEVYQMISHLTSQEQQKIIRSVLTSVANKEIKSKLQSGNKFSPSKKQKGNPFTTVKDRNNSLGVLSGVSGKFFYYRFTEFGTKVRYTKGYKTKTSYVLGRKYKKKVAQKRVYRGKMQKKAFAVDIIESNINNVVNSFIFDYGSQTKKVLDRLARKKASS